MPTIRTSRVSGIAHRLAATDQPTDGSIRQHDAEIELEVGADGARHPLQLRHHHLEIVGMEAVVERLNLGADLVQVEPEQGIDLRGADQGPRPGIELEIAQVSPAHRRPPFRGLGPVAEHGPRDVLRGVDHVRDPPRRVRVGEDRRVQDAPVPRIVAAVGLKHVMVAQRHFLRLARGDHGIRRGLQLGLRIRIRVVGIGGESLENPQADQILGPAVQQRAVAPVRRHDPQVRREDQLRCRCGIENHAGIDPAGVKHGTFPDVTTVSRDAA